MNDPFDFDEPVENPSWLATALVAFGAAAIVVFIILLAIAQP